MYIDKRLRAIVMPKKGGQNFPHTLNLIFLFIIFILFIPTLLLAVIDVMNYDLLYFSFRVPLVYLL